MRSGQTISSATLGIDLASKKEEGLFRWFLACLLFGKPIQQTIARRAYEALVGAGITNIDALLRTDWHTLVTLLDEAHYVRYDFSTATKLLQITKELKEKYGTVLDLVRTSRDGQDLANRLMAFKGIGPKTASIFVDELVPLWFPKVLSKDFDLAYRVAEILSNHGFEVYIIGGAVRDILLSRAPKDFDIVTNALPEQIITIPEFSLAKYKDPAQAYGVTRVKLEHQGEARVIEVATFRKDQQAHLGRKLTKVAFTDLADDVMRRDLTINALALNPATNQVIDYVGGIDDLERKSIRFIGDAFVRIREDPLRIMRAIRFKNHLDFSYDPQTAKALRNAASQGFVESIATDRLRDELILLLLHPTRRQAMLDLDEFGILRRILPEVVAGKGVPQPPQFHAEGDVWQHELTILEYLPESPSRRLAWAALLHDIGKPRTVRTPKTASDRIRFDRHYAVGAEMAKAILQRLNFSSKDIHDITWMVRNHMSIDDLPAMRPSHRQRMLGHPAFEDLLELHRADAAASWKPGKVRGIRPKFKEIERIWHEYLSKTPDQQQPSLKRDLGIDGHWLIERFGAEYDLKGPTVGKVLRELDDWYRDEGVADKQLYASRAKHLLEKALPQND